MASMGLPFAYKLHAVNSLAAGLGLTFFPRVITESTPYTRLSRYLKLSTIDKQSQPMSLFEEQQITSVGILMTAIGICYISSWNIPAPQNQFLYASVPIRLSVAALTAFNWVVNPRARDLLKVVIIAEDGIGALMLGWVLGSFKGSPPA